MALATVVQERGELGRQSHNRIASLVARIHQGYRTHPAVQAWAEAHALGETLRVAVLLATVD
jgi:aminoglycoside phosphotransferase family enzyme